MTNYQHAIKATAMMLVADGRLCNMDGRYSVAAATLMIAFNKKDHKKVARELYEAIRLERAQDEMRRCIGRAGEGGGVGV